MFKVKEKFGGKEYVVYDIRIITDDSRDNETCFLIYRDSKWEWVNSYQFMPIRSID